MRIDLDEEEFQMLLNFQRTMINDAKESGEYEEAKNRERRLKDLLRFAKRAA